MQGTLLRKTASVAVTQDPHPESTVFPRGDTALARKPPPGTLASPPARLASGLTFLRGVFLSFPLLFKAHSRVQLPQEGKHVFLEVSKTGRLIPECM